MNTWGKIVQSFISLFMVSDKQQKHLDRRARANAARQAKSLEINHARRDAIFANVGDMDFTRLDVQEILNCKKGIAHRVILDMTERKEITVSLVDAKEKKVFYKRKKGMGK